MGQTIDNISVNKYQAKAYGMDSVHGKSIDAAESQAKSSEGIGYIFDGEQAHNTKVDKTVDAFSEFLEKRQQEAKESSADEASREKSQKEAAKEIRQNLSAEEINQLKLMGVDVEGASMSDLQGMVNTMRINEHKARINEMLAKIAINNKDTDNLMLVGGSAKVAGSDVELNGVDASDVISAEASLEDDFSLGDKELIYLVRNELGINKENLYKAHFSGTMTNEHVGGVSDEEFSLLTRQLEDIIAKAGYSDEEQMRNTAMEKARFLMDNDLPVTPASVKCCMEYEAIKDKNIEEVSVPEDAETEIIAKSKELYDKVLEIDPRTAYDMADKGRQITIASLHAYQKNVNVDADKIDDNNLFAVTAKRQMEEIRLSMTMKAAGEMIKLDVNIDSKELKTVINKLKKLEDELAKKALKSEDIEITDENIKTYREVGQKIDYIAQAPAKILASPLGSEKFSVNSLYDTAQKANLEFEKIRASYEAVGTAPRADMGDSITKAFSNIDDILGEMGIEPSSENNRAVRILGYNQIEITKENIEQIVMYDREVNELINNFYPEAVLGLIKDGINPMEVPIGDLNRIIRKKNYNKGVSEATNFARYLRDVERRGEISEEERASYIGLYRVMDKLAKSGDREVGFIFESGGMLTVKNLISAMRSKKAAGIDVGIDDNFGLLEDVKTSGKKIDEQINAAFDQDIREHFNELPENVEEYIIENNISYNMVNAVAVDSMLNTNGGIYEMVFKFMAKLKFRDESSEELLDEETGKISESLLGREIPVDFEGELAGEKILEALNANGELSLKYDDLRDKLTDMMYNFGGLGVISSMDISAIKTINAGLSVMSQMAREDKYQIPLETEDGIRVVNLTIKKAANADIKNTIEVNFDSFGAGRISARIKLSNSAMIGQIVSDSSDGNIQIDNCANQISAMFKAEGFDVSSVSFGRINGMLSEGNSNLDADGEEHMQGSEVSSQSIYKAAVTLVRALGSI